MEISMAQMTQEAGGTAVRRPTGQAVPRRSRTPAPNRMNPSSKSREDLNASMPVRVVLIRRPRSKDQSRSAPDRT